MDTSLWSVIIGGVLGVLGYFFGWLTNRRKSEVDESTLVLGKWKELVDAHEASLKRLTDDFVSYKQQANEEHEMLRKRLRDVEEEFAKYRKETDRLLRVKDEEIAGLKRAIVQGSKSTAVLIQGEPKKHAEDQDAADKLDRAGHNRRKGNGNGH